MSDRVLLDLIPAQPGWFAQYRVDSKHRDNRYGRGGYKFAFLPVIGYAKVAENEGTNITVQALVSPFEGQVRYADEIPGFYFLEYYPDILHPEIVTGPRLAKSKDPNGAYWFRDADWVSDDSF